VQVYRNLNAGNLFSIKNKKSGLVVAHGDRFIVTNVQCKVSESGRQRVIKEKRKNVHATLYCTYIGNANFDVKHLDELFYNPYEYDTFINKRTFEPVHECSGVYFEDGKAYIIP
jgi:hypothetical protein